MGEKPGLVFAEAHAPVRVVFRRTDACPSTDSVWFPGFGILAMLTPNAATPVDIGPRAAGRYGFCSPNGEVRGCLVLEE